MQTKVKRGRYLAAGFIMLLFIGIIYAWSILSSSFGAEFGWTSDLLGTNFTIVMSFFCIGGVVGSVVTRKTSPRFTVILSAILIAVGFIAASRINAGTLWLLYLSYGIISSLGVGMAYNAILGVIAAWFPDKKGTASGVILMGFGASSLVLGSIAGKLMELEDFGWRSTYVSLGIVIAVVLIIGSFFAVRPPEGTVLPQKHKTGSAEKRDFSTSLMLQLPSFWIFFIIAILSNAVGIGIIGHAKYITLEVGAASQLATLSVGLLSVCNGLGRIVFGLSYDRLGRAKTMFTDVAAFTIACIVLIAGFYTGYVPIVMIGLVIIGLSYGGMPPISATFAGDYYGEKYYASNLSIVNISILPASFASLLSGRLQTASGSYLSTFFVLLCAAIIVIILNVVLLKVERKEKGQKVG